MVKKNFYLGALVAIALVFGMAVVGCDGGDKTYTVSFDANGATGGTAPAAVTVNAGAGTELPGDNGLTKTGYIFGGWNTNASGTGTNYAAGSYYTPPDSITLYAWWVDRLTSIADVGAYLASLPATTADSPASLPVSIDLGDMTEAGSGWQQLLGAINTARRFVNLDLSACTMDGTSFNSASSVTNGKDRIVSLVLPTAATSIVGASSGFSVLTAVSGANITTTGTLPSSLESVDFPKATTLSNYAFSGCSSLKSVVFPEVTSIGDSAFFGCTSLESANFPKVTSIGIIAFSSTGTTALTITMGTTAPTLGHSIFQSVSSAKTVTVKVPAGATGYGTGVSGADATANWANGLRGSSWNGTTTGSNAANQYITVVIERQ